MAAFKIGSSKVGSTDAIGVHDAIAPTLECGDSDWWSGAQRCFAGVAIAGAAAALSITTAIAGGFTRNAHTDEILPAPPSAGYSQGIIPTQRAHHAAVFVRFAQVDELPAGAAPPVVADDAGPALWRPVPPAPFLQQWAEPDQLPAAVAAVVDIDPWQPLWARLTPVPSNAIPALQTWCAPDELPVTVSFALDEGQHWNFDQKTRDVVTWTVWAENEEIIPPPPFWTVEAYAWPAQHLRPHVSRVTARDPWAPADEVAIEAAPFGIAEYEWTPPAPAIVLPRGLYLPDAGDSLPPVPFSAIEEYRWPVPAALPVSLRIADPWRPADEWVAPPVAFNLAEYEWQVYTPAPPRAQPLYLPDPEALPRVFPSFIPPEDYHWQLPVVLTTISLWVARDTSDVWVDVTVVPPTWSGGNANIARGRLGASARIGQTVLIGDARIGLPALTPQTGRIGNT